MSSPSDATAAMPPGGQGPPFDGCECASCHDAEYAGIRESARGAAFCMGDDSGGPIVPLAAATLAEAIAEARESAIESAREAADVDGSTALQDWVVYSRGADGEYAREDSDVAQADPDAPTCADGTHGHAWTNPTPEWSGYGNELGGGVTVVRACGRCGTVRTVKTRQSDNFANVYDSVSYECGEPDAWAGYEEALAA